MSDRSVWRSFLPWHRYAGALVVSLALILSLSFVQGAAQASPGASGLSPAAVYGPTTGTASDDALRDQVARDGWVLVQVEMRQPEDASAPRNAAHAAIWQDHLEQTAQDLLFGLPAGSYDAVQRDAGSTSLTLRVDAAGLDALLVSPLAVAVAAATNPDMQRIAAGSAHSLAIKTDGSLWAWGQNDSGQLGDGTGTDQPSPVQVLTGAAAVAAGTFHSLAIKTDDSLWAWGWNVYGQLGDGTGTDQPSPVQVLTEVTAVTAGHIHTLAIKTDGSLWAWGWNGFGQLGDGTGETRLSPVQVQVLTGVAAVAAGAYHSLALKTDGSLWAWGYNGDGELGDGTTETRLVPVQVLTGVTAVAAGNFRSFALKTDGSLWAWGYNGGGQLGDGTTETRLSPVQILTGVSAMDGGKYEHSLAIKTDGTLWGWGLNDSGQLGYVENPSVLPVQVLTGAAAVSAGGAHTLALKTDGSLWAWGDNSVGQLGDGGSGGGGTPVQVLGFGALPDFVVTNVVLTPSSPSATGTFNAAVTVKNQGAVGGTPGTLQVWANQPNAQACGAVGNKSVVLTSLAAGASRTVTVSGLPAGVAGLKTLRAFVDSQCQTPEITETNNQYTKTYTVTPPVPDFVVTGIVLTPASPIASGTFSAAVTVKNQGTLAGTPGTLQVWANQPSVQACGAAGDKSATLASLAAGASQTVTVSGLPAGAAADKTLRVFVDSACLTAESIETNNQTTKTYTVVPTPDFVVTSVVLTPSGPVANATFSVAVTVKNQGTLAGIPGTLQVWSNEPNVQACGAVGDKSVVLTSLAAGASQTVTVGSLPAGVAGAKTLRAFVDSTCLTAEPNEADNQFAKAYTVFTRPIPDFVVTGIVLTPASPTASGTFSAAVTVKNQGSGSGDGGWLDVWVNQPTVQTCPADGNAYLGVGVLAAGVSKTLTFSGLPAGAAGTKTLRAFVDSYCRTAEAYETNNQRVKSYSVVP